MEGFFQFVSRLGALSIVAVPDRQRPMSQDKTANTVPALNVRPQQCYIVRGEPQNPVYVIKCRGEPIKMGFASVFQGEPMEMGFIIIFPGGDPIIIILECFGRGGEPLGQVW